VTSSSSALALVAFWLISVPAVARADWPVSIQDETASHSNSEVTEVRKRGTLDCRYWLSARKYLFADPLMSWAMGYVSGVQAAKLQDRLEHPELVRPDRLNLISWLDGYCETHADTSFYEAVDIFARPWATQGHRP
jgi:hypothetical protein